MKTSFRVFKIMQYQIPHPILDIIILLLIIAFKGLFLYCIWPQAPLVLKF